LYDPVISEQCIRELKRRLNRQIEIKEVDSHINDPSFTQVVATLMDEMIRSKAPGSGALDMG
jgi:uncharacterized protein (UPF0261 family)